MSQTPLVSIIIPSRNRGVLLKPCLDAIQQQTLTDFEALILDDGSELSSRHACEQLLRNYDERFTLHLIHAPDTKGSGASFTRNRGIALARGEYLAFCDDDDYWNRVDYLKVAIEALQRQDADVCFSGIEVHDTDGRIIIDKMMPHVEQGLRPEQKLEGCDVHRVTREQMLHYPDYAHLNITITRKVLANQVGGFWPYTPYAEDVGFFIQLCDQADKILFRPEVCAVHNAPELRSDESVSNRMSLKDKRLLEISVYQRLLMICQSRAALDYIQKSLANTLKMVTEELKAKSKQTAVVSYARMAWGVFPTLKWGLYALWLSLKGK
jgi:glycosyltransferase involved in cell wall biosynthesis